jgi:hypothetical protein
MARTLSRKEAPMAPPREQSVTIPKVFLEAFNSEPRIVLKPFPGLWPIDPGLLKKGLLEKLMADKSFKQKFDIMIVPKG